MCENGTPLSMVIRVDAGGRQHFPSGVFSELYVEAVAQRLDLHLTLLCVRNVCMYMQGTSVKSGSVNPAAAAAAPAVTLTVGGRERGGDETLHHQMIRSHYFVASNRTTRT